MLTIKLHKIEYSLLIELIATNVLLLLDCEKKEDYFLVQASREVFEKILDKLSDELSQIGFDEDYEVNSKGRQIESLIDKFSVEL